MKTPPNPPPQKKSTPPNPPPLIITTVSAAVVRSYLIIIGLKSYLCILLLLFYSNILAHPEVRDAFLLFDKKDRGYIKSSEIGLVLRSMGQNPTEEELMDMINEADVDGESEGDKPQRGTSHCSKGEGTRLGGIGGI